jgi:hypothetical protein
MDDSDDLYSPTDGPSEEDEDGAAAFAAFRVSTGASVPVAPADASTTPPEKRPLYCRYCKKKLASRQTKEKHEKDACAKRPLADVADTTSGRKKEPPTKKSKAALAQTLLCDPEKCTAGHTHAGKCDNGHVHCTGNAKADEVPENEPPQYECGQCGWYATHKGSYTKHMKRCVNA